MISKTYLEAVLVSTASILVIITSAHAEGKRNDMERNIRKPTVAGQFYTADPQSLRREIESYMEGAGGEIPPGDIVAVVSPHAGYMYSGQIAACDTFSTNSP